jgi:hypothetical protein
MLVSYRNLNAIGTQLQRDFRAAERHQTHSERHSSQLNAIAAPLAAFRYIGPSSCVQFEISQRLNRKSGRTIWWRNGPAKAGRICEVS